MKSLEKNLPRLGLLLWALVAVALHATTARADAPPPLHHRLEVALDPAARHIEATDRLTLPDLAPRRFDLHGALEVELEGGRLERIGPAGEMVRYRVVPRRRELTFRYSGTFPPAPRPDEAAAVAGPEGVVLSGGSAWYPRFEGRLTFELEVALPEGWRSVSQGKERENGWRETHPQEEIYLIAAPFRLQRQRAGEVELLAFLRGEAPELAQRYLGATGRYLRLYGDLIGPYPYEKFALVENFWETGYGMPSFTLLGPRVIRLPFILHTSYPHEILHNWWGNGVYVDHASGNWAEGLTSYLADHLFQEQRGQGPAYRRDILRNYADFVRQGGRDFPLRRFRARHDASSEAIGYGKSQMLFHMTRRLLGDETFIEGLRHFYRHHRFRQAGYDDLRRSFEAVSKRDLSPLFDAWLERTGAPELTLRQLSVEETEGGWRLRAVVEQIQPSPPYPLAVPLGVTLEGRKEMALVTVTAEARTTPFELTFPARPLRIDLDPAFDLFRIVAPEEIPPALSLAFGAPKGVMVLPARAPEALRRAYRDLARQWRARGMALEVVEDDDLERLPEERAVWIVGWENRFAPELLEAAAPYGVTRRGEAIELDGQRAEPNRHGVVVALRARPGDGPARVWLAAPGPEAVAALARKLPHYRKYSYLLFEGPEAANRLKGQWLVADSPLAHPLVPGARRAALPERPPLSEQARPPASQM